MIPAADRDAVRARIIRLMSRVFGVDAETLTERTTPAQVERWDSLSLLTVLLGIERALGVAVPIDRAAELASIGDLVDVVCAGLPRGAKSDHP